MIKCLKGMKVTVKFSHPWIPKNGQPISLWAFFSLINDASEKPSEQENAKTFFREYLPPIMNTCDENHKLSQRLKELAEEFRLCTDASTKMPCCGICACFCEGDLIFSRNDQAKKILGYSFEGVHFEVKGPSGNKLDCMFFPCTTGENV
jgi:hypothetical protein